MDDKTNCSTGQLPDKIQWHAGFCSAMQLELMAQWPVLYFEREFSLTKKPLAVDLLVIRKDTDSVIENEVGRFFRRHNLLEYKSPEDEMGVDTYYKALAYACLYKTDAPTENGIPAEDITISLVREAYPRKLFHFFKEKEYQVTKAYDGIHYIKKDGFFDTQVIVTRELKKDANIWLTSLTGHLSAADTQKLACKIQMLSGKLPEELGASVLDVAIRANPSQFRAEINKEDTTMINCPALNELFAPEIKRQHAKGRVDKTKDLIRKKLAKNKSVETIAAELEEDDLDKIRALIQEVKEEDNVPVA